MPHERAKLTDILKAAAPSLTNAWNRKEAADDFSPIPTGTYVARLLDGELNNARSGTPGYKLSFRILEGEHEGRRFWHDVWLTEAALPMAKRDLAKIGIKKLEQLEQPVPKGIRVEVNLALRRDDDGNEFNRVRSFKVLGVDNFQDKEFPPVDFADLESPGDGPEDE